MLQTIKVTSINKRQHKLPYEKAFEFCCEYVEGKCSMFNDRVELKTQKQNNNFHAQKKLKSSSKLYKIKSALIRNTKKKCFSN